MRIDARAALEIDIPRTVNRFSPKFKKAQAFVDSEVIRTSEPYVPFQTGMLARSATSGTQIGTGLVVYDAPYARRMYYGNYNFNKNEHPQAGNQWFEKAKAVHGKEWVQGAEKILKE